MWKECLHPQIQVVSISTNEHIRQKSHEMQKILKLAKECFSPRSMLCKFQACKFPRKSISSWSCRWKLLQANTFVESWKHTYTYLCTLDRMTTLDDDVKLSMAYQSWADHSVPRFWHVLTGGWRKRLLQWMGSTICTFSVDGELRLLYYICTFSPAPGWHTQVQLWIGKEGSLSNSEKNL